MEVETTERVAMSFWRATLSLRRRRAPRCGAGDARIPPAETPRVAPRNHHVYATQLHVQFTRAVLTRHGR